MGIGEVLPLQTGVRQLLLHGLDEKIDKFVVGIARDTLVPPTEVLGRFQSVFVVRSHVKHDRQGSGRVNAADQRIESELPNGYPHASHALIADSQDSLAVRHHNDVTSG